MLKALYFWLASNVASHELRNRANWRSESEFEVNLVGPELRLRFQQPNSNLTQPNIPTLTKEALESGCVRYLLFVGLRRP